jgi:hypothetical protein
MKKMECATQVTCHYCGADDGQTLVPECKCVHSQKTLYHPKCVDVMRRVRKWETVNRCPSCKHLYYGLEEAHFRPRRFFCYVARDFLVSFLVVCILLYLNTLFVWKIDEALCATVMEKNDCLVRTRYFPTGWSACTIYSICGTLFFLAEIGFIGLCASCVRTCDDSPPPRHDTCCCHTGNGPILCDCRASDCGGGGNNDAGAPVCLLLCILLFAVIGVFYAIAAILVWCDFIIRRHVDKLYVQSMVEEYPFAVIVEEGDLQTVVADNV